MRQIFIVYDRYGTGERIAFSRRRAAERYRDLAVKRRWKELTDLEALGERYMEVIRRTARQYGDTSVYADQQRDSMAQGMAQARALIDRGYRAFAAEFPYNYGGLATIEEITLYRTTAEATA